MTCIVSLKEKDGTIWMGADSAAVDDVYGRTILSEEKVFIKQTAKNNTTLIMGVAGLPRTLQLIHYKLTIPEIPAKENDLMRYMVVNFIEAMRKCFYDSGHSRKKDNEEEYDSEIILGIQGRIFIVDCGYQIIECKKPYTAIGMGTDYALGVLYTTEKESPRSRIRKALKAASYFNSSVCEPFVIKKLTYEKTER